MRRPGALAIGGFFVLGSVLVAPAQTPPETSSSAAVAELRGRVDFKGVEGTLTAAPGTVVWVPRTTVERSPATAAVKSHDKRFVPHILVVDTGTTVAFPNVDPIYHNVFSRTEGSEFDLGLYRKGASRSFRFDRPALVRVYCNIHPDMAAYVMVLDKVISAMTAADGTFGLSGIPAGRHSVHLWNEWAGETNVTVELAAGERKSLDVVLDATQHKTVPHKNKHGKDYPPVTKDVDRY